VVFVACLILDIHRCVVLLSLVLLLGQKVTRVQPQPPLLSSN
jgi:hypothetical protein